MQIQISGKVEGIPEFLQETAAAGLTIPVAWKPPGSSLAISLHLQSRFKPAVGSAWHFFMDEEVLQWEHAAKTIDIPAVRPSPSNSGVSELSSRGLRSPRSHLPESGDL